MYGDYLVSTSWRVCQFFEFYMYVLCLPDVPSYNDFLALRQGFALLTFAFSKGDNQLNGLINYKENDQDMNSLSQNCDLRFHVLFFNEKTQ